MTTFNLFRNALFQGTCLTLLLFVLPGCGRKGPPKPPEDFAPKPVVSPTIAGTVDGIVISWTAPEPEEESDEEEPNPPLEHFSLQKGLVEVGERVRLEEVAVVPLRASSAAPVDPAKAAAEKLYSYTDSEVEPGKTYQYQVLPVNVDGVEGEATVNMRATFLGENSRIEMSEEKSKRPDRKLAKDRDDDDLSEQ